MMSDRERGEDEVRCRLKFETDENVSELLEHWGACTWKSGELGDDGCVVIAVVAVVCGGVRWLCGGCAVVCVVEVLMRLVEG